jgi:uroporphyrinogen decarboxylase
MTTRERILAILNYQEPDALPLVHFGYWRQTLLKWADEGHISRDLAQNQRDGNAADREIDQILGWDQSWSNCHGVRSGLHPRFEHKVIKELPDGSKHVRNHNGVTELMVPGAVSIQAEIDHLLKDRASWEEHYKWRFQWDPARFDGVEFSEEDPEARERARGLFCGSFIGWLRDILGIENLSYLQVDDEELFLEIVQANADVIYNATEYVLERFDGWDFGHFWEDICFKSGPLISPTVFEEVIAPHIRRVTGLLNRHGIDLISVDCDGKIDHLVPIWLEAGVNVMFPIEVGTWQASIEPWRAKYGREVRGVGGMNKTVFGQDFAAVDAEIERLKPLVALGGYIPCPDHRIAPEAKWDNVRYYCDRMRQTFG